MHLIVCIDDRDGLHFGGRRLSSDRRVTEHILQFSKGNKLWMNEYSQKLFTDADVLADEHFLERAGKNDYCFLENTPVSVEKGILQSVILYRWNRCYPSTERFPRELLEGMHLTCTEDFPGNSHDKITMERYIL